MKIKYAYFWIIHALYFYSAEATKSEFELTLKNNHPKGYALDFEDQTLALKEAGKLSFIEVTEQRNEDKKIVLLGATRYDIKIESAALSNHYKEVTDAWTQQLSEELSKKLSGYSDAVKKRIILVADLIIESYEMTQATARPKELSYLRIPIEKFTANGVVYEDLRYAITCLWQVSRMRTSKHIPTDSLHIEPFPEYILAEVMLDIKKFKARLQGASELDKILEKKVQSILENTKLLYFQDGVIEFNSNTAQLKVGTKTHALVSFLSENKKTPFTIKDLKEWGNVRILKQHHCFQKTKDVQDTIRDVRNKLKVKKGDYFPIHKIKKSHTDQWIWSE